MAWAAPPEPSPSSRAGTASEVRLNECCRFKNALLILWKTHWASPNGFGSACNIDTVVRPRLASLRHDDALERRQGGDELVADVIRRACRVAGEVGIFHHRVELRQGQPHLRVRSTHAGP